MLSCVTILERLSRSIGTLNSICSISPPSFESPERNDSNRAGTLNKCWYEGNICIALEFLFAEARVLYFFATGGFLNVHNSRLTGTIPTELGMFDGTKVREGGKPNQSECEFCGFWLSEYPFKTLFQPFGHKETL